MSEYPLYHEMRWNVESSGQHYVDITTGSITQDLS
jgi:hypothetical protein